MPVNKNLRGVRLPLKPGDLLLIFAEFALILIFGLIVAWRKATLPDFFGSFWLLLAFIRGAEENQHHQQPITGRIFILDLV